MIRRGRLFRACMYIVLHMFSATVARRPWCSVVSVAAVVTGAGRSRLVRRRNRIGPGIRLVRRALECSMVFGDSAAASGELDDYIFLSCCHGLLLSVLSGYRYRISSRSVSNLCIIVPLRPGLLVHELCTKSTWFPVPLPSNEPPL